MYQDKCNEASALFLQEGPIVDLVLPLSRYVKPIEEEHLE